MAVDEHHEMEHDEHTERYPSGDASTPDDEYVGQEHDHPEEVGRVKEHSDKKTLDSGVLADGCQQVGLDEHEGCLLSHKTHAEIHEQ